MSKGSKSKKSKDKIRSEEDLIRLAVNIARAAQADSIICVTESTAFAQQIVSLADPFRIIVATMSPKTYAALTKAGLEIIRLPLHALDKYRQIRHVLSVALRLNKIAIGEFILCVIGLDVYPDEGNLLILTDVEPSFEDIAITDLLKLTDGIRPKALEAALTVACKIGRAARRGKRIGTIFILGDSLKVLEDSSQLIPNPFQGQDQALCMLTNPDIHDALVELAKLDGAFVVRGDGLIMRAGVFLASASVPKNLPGGLGARHAAAAATTARTDATAIVISATDGNIRVFSEGRMVLQMDPNIEYGLICKAEE